jgi:hypothetical protein
MGDDPYLGWTSDHVGKLEKLRSAVRILAEGHKKFRDRIDEATFALIRLDANGLPAHLRSRFERIHRARLKAARSEGRYFSFSYLTQTQRDSLVRDIIDLYEACLIDIGRTWPRFHFMYPQDVEPPKRKRRHRSRAKLYSNDRNRHGIGT